MNAFLGVRPVQLRHSSLRLTCVSCWVLFGAAVACAAAVSQRGDWWRYSICELGATTSRTAWIFNAGMVASAALFAYLAFDSRIKLQRAVDRGALAPTQLRGIVMVTALVAVNLVMVGLIPFDLGAEAKLVHNIAGWGDAWIVGLAMLTVPFTLRVFGPRFYALTWASAIAFATLFIGFELGSVAYAVTEIGAVIVAAVWTTMLFSELERVGEGQSASRD